MITIINMINMLNLAQGFPYLFFQLEPQTVRNKLKIIR